MKIQRIYITASIGYSTKENKNAIVLIIVFYSTYF